MKKKILEILEEGKKYGYNNDAIANELLNLHSVSNICQCSDPVFSTYEYTNKPVCTKCRKL